MRPPSVTEIEEELRYRAPEEGRLTEPWPHPNPGKAKLARTAPIELDHWAPFIINDMDVVAIFVSGSGRAESSVQFWTLR